MDWTITLSAQKSDVERLLPQQIEGLSANSDDPRQLLLTLRDPEGQATGEDGSDLARAKIEGFINRLNALGRLRWGRVFEGVSIAGVKSFDENGQATQHVFLGTAVEHMLPRTSPTWSSGLVTSGLNCRKALRSSTHSTARLQ